MLSDEDYYLWSTLDWGFSFLFGSVFLKAKIDGTFPEQTTFLPPEQQVFLMSSSLKWNSQTNVFFIKVKRIMWTFSSISFYNFYPVLSDLALSMVFEIMISQFDFVLNLLRHSYIQEHSSISHNPVKCLKGLDLLQEGCSSLAMFWFSFHRSHNTHLTQKKTHSY